MRPHGKYAKVDAKNPEAFAQCDRCGFWFNRADLMWQIEWAGTHLYNIQLLVCNRCYDRPQEQFRTIILPPDPPPVINARPPNFAYEEGGPAQTTLVDNVAQGSTTLPVSDASVFSTGNNILVQLNNGGFAQEQVTGVDTNSNLISVLYPLPFSAPINGVVSLAPI